MRGNPPNLLFVFPDQMRRSGLGFLGVEPVRTPHLDRFAGESLVLTDAVSNFPVCSPYRAMLMTGQYPHANGVTGNCNSDTTPYGVELRTEAACWSDVLASAGYSLGYVGKWHLDSPREPYIDCRNNHGDRKWNEWCPPGRRHGFDFWYAYGTYDEHLRPMYWTTDAPRDGFHYVDQWGPEHEADQAVAYLRNEGGRYRDADRPFALVVSMNPPHTDYHLYPPRYASLYDGVSAEALCRSPAVPPPASRWGDYFRRHVRDYLAMISGVDEQFGRIVAELGRLGLAEDTVVVFTSDHGNSLGMHERQAKPSPFEECMPVPFLIRWPGRIAPRRDDLLLSAPDVCPTLLELMGLGDRIPPSVEGTSYARLMCGAAQDRPTSQLYLRPDYARPAGGSRGLRTHRHTLVVDRDGNGGERTTLYDRQADPHQLRDAAADQPAVVAALSAEMNDWLARTADPWLAPSA